MDNTGNYISYDELIVELFQGASTKVTAVAITLSGKTVDAGGDIYDFAAGPIPKIGDVIEQAGESDIIKAFPTPTKIQLTKTGVDQKIVNGLANLLHSDSVPKKKGELLIKQSMDMLDSATGQFFNKRTGLFDLEGENNPVLWFPVPIIEITELIINSTETELLEGEDKDFVAFKGRAMPADDRRNPKIKLNVGRGRDSIFTGSTSRVFTKGTLTHITGSFGFLEPDGSTPPLIKKATLILAITEINKPIVSTAGNSETGPLKRVKVDLHEKEFFELKEQTENSSGKTSGSTEVDRIISMYRTPIRLGGSFQRLPYEGQVP